MKYSPRWVLALLAAIAFSTGRAEAGFTFAFDQDSYTVSPGGTVDVKVFLRGTDPVSTAVLTTDGLVTAGVEVDFQIKDLSGQDIPGPSRIVSTADIIPNPLFDAPPPFLQTALAPDSTFIAAQLSEAADLVSPNVLATGSEGILLGTFRFTAGNPGVTTGLVAKDYSLLGQLISGAGEILNLNLDSIDAGFATIEVTEAPVNVVPAPSAILLAAIGLSGLGLSGRIRRSYARA